MNFDDFYMLKLYIKISDYENAYKHYRRVKTKIDDELKENLSVYCTDKNIYKLYEKEKTIINPEFLLNLIKNPFNNFEIIKEYINMNKNKINMNKFFDEDKSIIIYLLRNYNSVKKLRTYKYLLENFDLNEKNQNGQTNSQILIQENPTDIDSVYLEKLEKLTQNKNEENKFLFETNDMKFNSDNILVEIKNFIKEPEESIKLNFADVEYNLLLLNLKLRRMYEFNINSLKNENGNLHLNKIHSAVMNSFIFDKLLLDKI